MNPPNPLFRFATIPHKDATFEAKSIYLSGQSFENCTFRSCTLIIKDLNMVGSFENCRFENCNWYLNMTIHDPRVWDEFIKGFVPAISAYLPAKSDERAPA